MTAVKLPIGINEIIPNLPKAQIQYKIETFNDCERDYIQRLMTAAKGNILEAVRMSGLSRGTIYRKISQYGITRPN